MKLVMRGEHKRDRALPRQGAQPGELETILFQLGLVAAPEFGPASRIVPEPLAQRCARRDTLEPFIDGGCFLTQTAGPKPVDQYPGAIVAGRALVCALHPDAGCGDPLGHRLPLAAFQ